MSEPGERARSGADEGLDHLQAAAKEMIAAARSFLDAAEGLVDDPSAVRSVSSLVNDVVRRFADMGRAATGGATGGDDDDDGYERIRVG